MGKKHIGSIIKKKLNERAISIGDFAKMLNCHRTTVYSIFKRENIDTDLLVQISEILEYDFFNNVYYGKNTEIFTKKEPQIFIGRLISREELDKMALPEDFIILVTNKK